MSICPKCGYDEEEEKLITSHVIDYDEIRDALKLNGRIQSIELRDEYNDMIIVTKKDVKK